MLEAPHDLQRRLVVVRQQLHEDDHDDLPSRIDPEVGVIDAAPTEAADRAHPLLGDRRRLDLKSEAEPVLPDADGKRPRGCWNRRRLLRDDEAADLIRHHRAERALADETRRAMTATVEKQLQESRVVRPNVRLGRPAVRPRLESPVARGAADWRARDQSAELHKSLGTPPGAARVSSPTQDTRHASSATSSNRPSRERHNSTTDTDPEW